MSEPVLERSVLERKERDELQTIARAMGAEPGSRARKADLVDIILSKAGIATDATPASNGGSASPTRRRRTTKADAPVNGSATDEAEQTSAAEADPDDAPVAEVEAPSSNGKVEDAATTEPVPAVESPDTGVAAPPAP